MSLRITQKNSNKKGEVFKYVEIHQFVTYLIILVYMLVNQKEQDRIQEEIDVNKAYANINKGIYLDTVEYNALVKKTHDKRIDWWRKARFGIFIHYGLYSSLGYGEWSLAWDSIPKEEYNSIKCCYKSGNAEKWVVCAKRAGAKYVVLTTRHHEGFSLWDSKVNKFNSVNLEPHIDIVKEFTDACRKHNMKIGLYSSIMDWNSEDNANSLGDYDSQKRFFEYIYNLNKELLTNYGKIDILWYDMPYPLTSSQGFLSHILNQRLRALQPDIIINNRCSGMEEDFSSPEEKFVPLNGDWETCLTFNQISWGYVSEKEEINYQYTPQQIISKLAYCARNGGNMLLNFGPDKYGNIPESIEDKLLKVGKWLKENKDAIYGKRRKCFGLVGGSAYGEYGGNMTSIPTAKGNNVYLIEPFWHKKFYISGYNLSPKKVYILSSKQELKFTYENNCIIIDGILDEYADKILGLTTIVLQFDKMPSYRFCVKYPQINDGNIAW